MTFFFSDQLLQVDLSSHIVRVYLTLKVSFLKFSIMYLLLLTPLLNLSPLANWTCVIF